MGVASRISLPAVLEAYINSFLDVKTPKANTKIGAFSSTNGPYLQVATPSGDI